MKNLVATSNAPSRPSSSENEGLFNEPLKQHGSSSGSARPSRFMKHPALNEERGLRDALRKTADSPLIRPRTTAISCVTETEKYLLQKFFVDLEFYKKNHPDDPSKWPDHIRIYCDVKAPDLPPPRALSEAERKVLSSFNTDLRFYKENHPDDSSVWPSHLKPYFNVKGAGES
jgi:hypothetical protein